jgi:hypothetical protein
MLVQNVLASVCGGDDAFVQSKLLVPYVDIPLSDLELKRRSASKWSNHTRTGFVRSCEGRLFFCLKRAQSAERERLQSVCRSLPCATRTGSQ